MTKRILALLLALCLIISAAPVTAGAATGQQVSAGSVTVTAGNTATVTLKAENFESIATMDIDVYYDAQVLTLSSTSNGSFLSGAQASVNTAEAGLIKLSAMSLNGLSGSGTLLTIKFSTAANCTPGTYPISVAVGRAHHTDLSAATVGSVSGSVTVNPRPVTQETFGLNHYFSKSTLKQGDILTYRVASSSSSRAFVSGDFTVTYDHTLFRFVSVELESALTGEGAVYSTNEAVLGQVRVVYINENPVNTSYLFKVNLEVIADTDTSATIKTQAANVYKADLSAYLPGSCSGTITLQKKPEVVDYPNAFLQTEELVVDRENQSTFYLEAGAGVAAADFVINYDPSVLSCVGVAAAQEASQHGGMVIINDNFTEGTIRFSYVNMNAYADTDLPLVNITWKPIQSPAEHYQVTLRGVGVVDTQQNAVQLEYVTESGCILVREVIPPVCLTDGRTHYGCACGEGYDVDIVPMLGHDIHQFDAREVTCTEIGWDAYEACSRCDYSTYAEIPALDHDYIDHIAQTVTCTGIGWDTYQTCGRCDYTTYAEIPALGHRKRVKAPVPEDFFDGTKCLHQCL